MALLPHVLDIPQQMRRWRDGPVDFETTERGLVMPGRHALIPFEEDFLTMRIGAANVSGWIVNNSGAVSAALTQVTAGHAGLAVAQPGASATNNAHYQWGTNTTVLSPFTMVAGKRLWLSTRFKLEDVDQNLPIVGLHTSQTDPWNTEPADQFLFRKLTGSTTLEFVSGTTNSTERSASLCTLTDDTFVRLEAFYDGVGIARAWAFNDTNNQLLGTVTLDASATHLPNGAMTVAFGMEMLDTGADDFTIDYLNVYMER